MAHPRFVDRVRPAEWVVIVFVSYAFVRMALAGKFEFNVQTAPRVDVICALLAIGAVKLALAYRRAPWPADTRTAMRVHWTMLVAFMAPSLVLVAFGPALRGQPDANSAGLDAIVVGAHLASVKFVGYVLPTLTLWLAMGLTIKERGRFTLFGLLRDRGSDLAAAVREWAPPVVLVYSYGLMGPILGSPIFPDQDDRLRAIDRALFFGHDPVLALERIIWPPLSEWLSGCYVFYLFLIPIVLATVYARGELWRFRETALATALVLASGYILYTVVPAQGPLFTQTFHVNIDVYYSGRMKHQLVELTRIPRDCFPSLHTGLSLVLLWGLWRHVRLLFWILLPIVASIPFACVYLRYHYVTDIIAGFALFGCVATVSRRWQARYEARIGSRERVIAAEMPATSS